MNNIGTEPILDDSDVVYLLQLIMHDKCITEKMTGKISPESIKAKLDQIDRCEKIIKNLRKARHD